MTDADLYEVRRGRRARIRLAVLRPICNRYGHPWRPVPGLSDRTRTFPSGHTVRTRGLDRCHRCGLLRWSW